MTQESHFCDVWHHNDSVGERQRANNYGASGNLPPGQQRQSDDGQSAYRPDGLGCPVRSYGSRDLRGLRHLRRQDERATSCHDENAEGRDATPVRHRRRMGRQIDWVAACRTFWQSCHTWRATRSICFCINRRSTPPHPPGKRSSACAGCSRNSSVASCGSASTQASHAPAARAPRAAWRSGAQAIEAVRTALAQPGASIRTVAAATGISVGKGWRRWRNWSARRDQAGTGGGRHGIARSRHLLVAVAQRGFRPIVSDHPGRGGGMLTCFWNRSGTH
jgi:hypothetical protein